MVDEQTDVQVPKDAIVSRDDKWDFHCPEPAGCGDPATGRSFESTGWATKKNAAERGRQHLAEHGGLGIMQDLHEFRTERGLA